MAGADALAGFLGGNARRLIFTANVTAAINIVASRTDASRAGRNSAHRSRVRGHALVLGTCRPATGADASAPFRLPISPKIPRKSLRAFRGRA